MTEPFGTRLEKAFARYGQLCVGIDPHPYLLGEWGLPATPAGARDFGLRVVEAAATRAPLVKPQVAFYERYGSAGFAALEDVLAAARETDLLVIGDAKRGDIGTTMDAYGDAWFGDDSPLRVDAATAAAYQGLGADAGFLAKARAAGRGVFILAATSNPEARLTQTAILDGGSTVAAGIVEGVLADNALFDQGMGSTGLVLGATVDLRDYRIDVSSLTTTPILAPGFGAQGAQYSDIKRLFGAASGSVLVSASRSILSAGPSGIGEAVERASGEVTACLA